MKNFMLIALLTALLSGCAGHSIPSEGQSSFGQTGKASYYAAKFENRKTASGEIYKGAKLTAAHRSLPFGTRVKVTNLANDKTVVVRINDRGPFVKGRIIDLSKTAFSSIGRLSEGLLKVRIELVSE